LNTSSWLFIPLLCTCPLKPYHLTSTIAKAVREHWGIENSLREDLSRVRVDHAPENLSIIRRMATNLLKKENSLNGGLQTKRLKAAWEHSYLLKILSA